MMSNFWQHCPISALQISKNILQHLIFFCKNEAFVNCGTHKRHNPNLVTPRSMQMQRVNVSGPVLYVSGNSLALIITQSK